MPEYLAPGVYVEEVSFRSKSIEGVATTTTGFIGSTRTGPYNTVPDVLTSIGEFERVYGDGQPLTFAIENGQSETLDNFSWHAVRAFFAEGGVRLYFMRVFRAENGNTGVAHWERPTGLGLEDQNLELRVQAAWPGAAGNQRVRVTVRLGQNVLGTDPQGNPTAKALQANDVVWIGQLHTTSPANTSFYNGDFYLATTHFDPASQRDIWRFRPATGPSRDLQLKSPLDFDLANDQIRAVTVSITVFPSDVTGQPQVWSDLALDPTHQNFGAPDSFAARFEDSERNRSASPDLPITITLGRRVLDGLQVLDALRAISTDLVAPSWGVVDPTERSFDFQLAEGNDGMRPTATEYEGKASPDEPYKTGLRALEDIDDIAIVAAPGSTFGFKQSQAQADDTMTILNLLIAHAQYMRYRIAVLDCGDGLTISQVRAMRGKLDSKYAAFYYPWVTVRDPVTRRELNLPPSGFVAGIYARNDILRAVYKAPANEVVNLALAFEHTLNKAQQDVLNPEGINCFRFFEGRGYRLWGARTISSDPEWKYVNLRRYFAYVEHSIDRGTQWAVFEPNGPLLWTNIRHTIEDFLFTEWSNGALLGDKPDQAYFVRCDRSTMTQNDLDNGRLVCLIGISVIRPAEFVIFRIGQWTADSKR